MMIKPSIPKGTRDFGPQDVQKRNYIFRTIKKTFELFGYQPIETPVMENLQTLTGKYGEEGDKLLFKILNNGDYLAKADAEALAVKDSSKLTASISKRGLRYDLTVPFARYVVMHQHELSLPFKRYQIQPVWRADRPQKGRYQEFYQCDADVVGSTSLMYEAELIMMIDQVFTDLGIQVRIRINNRKILEGIAEMANCRDQLTTLTVAIDKLQKIGREKVAESLVKSGLQASQVDQVFDLIGAKSLSALSEAFSANERGQLGTNELSQIFDLLTPQELNNELIFDATLARGLDYYTGCIFEVEALDYEMGSILGGGRYDNLTEYFGLKGISGVGISFGVARIFDVMEGLGAFPNSIQQPLILLFVALDKACHQKAFQLLHSVRSAGISSDLYPEPTKMKKQMKYANAMGVPYVVVVGSEEIERDRFQLKNMISGEQNEYTLEQIIELTSRHR